MSRHDFMVKRNIDIAFDMLAGEDTQLQLWVVKDLAPEAVLLKANPPAGDEQAMSVGLGLITRTERCEIGESSIKVGTAEGVVVEIPYAGIYCLLADPQFGKLLGWPVHTWEETDPNYDPDEPSLAYINLLTEEQSEILDRETANA